MDWGNLLFTANVVIGGFIKNKTKISNSAIPYVNAGLNTATLFVKNMIEGKPLEQSAGEAVVSGLNQAFMAMGVHQTGKTAQQNVSFMPGHKDAKLKKVRKDEAKAKIDLDFGF